MNLGKVWRLNDSIQESEARIIGATAFPLQKRANFNQQCQKNGFSKFGSSSVRGHPMLNVNHFMFLVYTFFGAFSEGNSRSCWGWTLGQHVWQPTGCPISSNFAKVSSRKQFTRHTVCTNNIMILLFYIILHKSILLFGRIIYVVYRWCLKNIYCQQMVNRCQTYLWLLPLEASMISVNLLAGRAVEWGHIWRIPGQILGKALIFPAGIL